MKYRLELNDSKHYFDLIHSEFLREGIYDVLCCSEIFEVCLLKGLLDVFNQNFCLLFCLC
jgi:hypothetical protein